MSTMYKVVGHCAHATIQSPSGRVRQMFFKGAMLPADVPQVEIQHLLSVKLIAPVEPAPVPQAEPEEPTTAGSEGGEAGSGEVGTGEPPGSGEGESPGEPANTNPDAEVEQQRAEARAKLESAGGKPSGRHGQPVWVEYLVSKGYDYAAVAKEPKEELVKLAESIAQ